MIVGGGICHFGGMRIGLHFGDMSYLRCIFFSSSLRVLSALNFEDFLCG